MCTSPPAKAQMAPECSIAADVLQKISPLRLSRNLPRKFCSVMIKGVGNLGSKQLIEKNFFQMRPSRRAIMTTAECQELSSCPILEKGKTT